MSAVRAELLNECPFFGRLLLHLILAATDCGTACTDMVYFAMDPDFAASLPDEEIKFVTLHEVMHCVLKHCVRGKTLDNFMYNVACDIVVNSLILESMGVETFTLDGEEPMHTAPNGQEELAEGIIILTDGYAAIPDEAKALGVPVLWVWVNSDVVPGWVTAVHIRE